jgi:hypothetical protein
MLWKRFLLSRATRWTTCAALVFGVDFHLNSRFASSSLNAQVKKETTQDEKKKKTADELRKELEEKLKGIDLNDPKFDEITKEYEKLIKEAIGKVPQVVPNGFQGRDVEELRKRMQKDALERGVFPAQPNPLILEIPNRPPTGRFGIMIEPVPDLLREQVEIPANAGQVVKEVVPGSVAEKVGMKVNDIVIEFNGKSVPVDSREFVQMVLDHKANVETTIVVIRKGKKETIKGVKLPEVKAQAPAFQPNIDAAIVGDVDKLLKELVEQRGIALDLDLTDFGKQGIALDVADADGNGTFSIQSSRNGVEITITGSRNGKEKQVKSIKIKEGDTTVEVESVDKVPEQYREVVQKLLKSVR